MTAPPVPKNDPMSTMSPPSPPRSTAVFMPFVNTRKSYRPGLRSTCELSVSTNAQS